MMFFNKDTLIALIVAPIWFAILITCYYIFGIKKAKSTKFTKNTFSSEIIGK